LLRFFAKDLFPGWMQENLAAESWEKFRRGKVDGGSFGCVSRDEAARDFAQDDGFWFVQRILVGVADLVGLTGFDGCGGVWWDGRV
jgi:hypothetical protein